MRIVFTSMFRESMGGGAGRVTEEIVQAFLKKHLVLYIKPGATTKLKTNGNLSILEIKSGGKKEIAIPNLGPKNSKKIFSVLDKFSADVIHAQDPGPLSLVAQMWAKKNNTPFYYTSHVLPTKTAEFNVVEISKKLGKLFDSRLIRKYFTNFFNHCDGVIALNQAAKNDIQDFGYKGKIYLIPNGRDLNLFKRNKKQITGKVKLIFVGYLTHRKNQKYLIEAMKYLPKDYELVLAGPFIDKKYFIELKEMVESLNLDNVSFLGRVDYERVPELLEKSTVFVSASKMEVQSLAVMEALASGTPVVGLSNETIDEFVDSNCGFRLLRNTIPKDFAKKVKVICNLSSNEYSLLSDNARKKVSKLDWDNIVKLTVKAYEDETKKKPVMVKLKMDSKILLKSFNKDKITINMLGIATFLGNYFYSLIEGANNFLDKFKD